MKLFAMLMLRCALVMILSSLLQNGTFATLGESSTSCQEEINEFFKAVGENPFDINQHLDFLKKVNKFPFEGMEMEKLLKRQLPKPVKIVIGNCKKLEKEHKKVVEHIMKHKWTSGNTKEIENLFQDLCKLSENKVQFCDTNSFTNAWVWTQEKTLRESLDELAEIAMKETAPLKAIITKNLAEKDKKMILQAYQVKGKKVRRIEIEK
uniref:Secreted protein n=1 Tax=Globodera rostochiensis TaxID=31243 RepID=A0A914HJI0_GLORO